MAGKRIKRPQRAALSPVTVEAALKVVDISDLRVSPDGELVAFVRSVLRKNEKTRGTSIWAVSSEATTPRQLTQGPQDGQPRWSPDGRMLAFTRKLEEDKPPQIFLLPRDGGEPAKLGDLDMAPEALDFTPDGKRISFLAETPDDRRSKQRKEKGDDARAFVKDDKPKRLWTVSVKSGRAKLCSPPNVAIWEYGWMPDGKSAAVIYTHEPRIDNMMNGGKIGVLDTAKARVRDLGAVFGWPGSLRVSPDGSHVALMGGTAGLPSAGQAWTVDTRTGAKTCLTEDAPLSVQSLEWLPDGTGLLITAAEGVLSPLYILRLAAASKLEPVCANRLAAIDAVALASDGTRAFVVSQDSRHGPEIWRAELATDDAVQLTDENSSVQKLKLGRSLATHWTSTEDFEIEGILTLPPGYRRGRRYPTILVVHGGPAGRFREDLGLLPKQLLANQGYVVLMPNPRGSSAYGVDFVRANFQDWGGGDFRDLMTGLDTLVEQGIADPARLGIWGGSYGGYMTAWTVTQTDRFKAAVCQCGLTDLYSFHGQTDITPNFLQTYLGTSPYDDPERYRAHSAMTYILQAKTPTLFLHGEQDVRVPIPQSYEMYWGLRHIGVETEFVIYPREGHGIAETPHVRDLYRRVLDWFAKYLK